MNVSEILLPNHRIGMFTNMPLNISSFSVTMVLCPSGHVTRDYLSCDEQSGCVTNDKLEYCKMVTRTSLSDATDAEESSNEDRLYLGEMMRLEVPMFKCERSGIAISYTMVCDYERQCFDNSDESFCVFDACLSTGKYKLFRSLLFRQLSIAPKFEL